MATTGALVEAGLWGLQGQARFCNSVETFPALFAGLQRLCDCYKADAPVAGGTSAQVLAETCCSRCIG